MSLGAVTFLRAQGAIKFVFILPLSTRGRKKEGKEKKFPESSLCLIFSVVAKCCPVPG